MNTTRLCFKRKLNRPRDISSFKMFCCLGTSIWTLILVDPDTLGIDKHGSGKSIKGPDASADLHYIWILKLLAKGISFFYFNQASEILYFFREFEYDKTMRLWEILWTHHLSEHFHLYVCVAILKRNRSKIMGEQMDFDTLLKFINGLSGRIDLDLTLRGAEALCIYAGENGAACIPPGTPPSLPQENASMYPQYEDDVLWSWSDLNLRLFLVATNFV